MKRFAENLLISVIFTILSLLAFFILATLPIVNQSAAADEIEIPQALEDTCRAKGDVTAFVYEHRDRMSEEAALDLLESEWENEWSQNPNIKWATYLDMQRILRDAYRTNSNDQYKRECCTDEIIERETVGEMIACLHNLKF